jgi:hypothetical protein
MLKQNNNQEFNQLLSLLNQKFDGKILLSKSECASVLNCSVSSLDRQKKLGVGVEYIQETPRSNVFYSIDSIANHIINSKKKTL